jgi:hypothetical protein
MPFPLPIDPTFRKECIQAWIEDVDERLSLGLPEDAKQSWKIANSIYLSLPPGQGDILLENLLLESRVKLEQHTTKQANANCI